MSETRLTFKEMCAEFDVTPRTLRYYEYIELLSPDREGRSRFYGTRERVRMKLILRGRKFGFQLDEIRQWLELYEKQDNHVQAQAFMEMADRQLKAVNEQRVQIDEAIEELTLTRAEIEKTLTASDA